MKRAQAAMEYLLTYGWAILVVIVMVGAMVYFGTINTSPSKCELENPFVCAQYKVSKPLIAGTNGVVILGIVPIKSVSYVNVTVDCLRDGMSNSSNTFNQYMEKSFVINNSIYFSCPMPAGGAFRANIFIDYTLSDETVVHTSKGSLVAPIED